MRPTKVAVPVASATGKNVRALNSGIISSMANITPPIGVLNVAAMPAPAPAVTSVMRCHGATVMICPSEEPIAAPIWMIGPSRPTAAPVPIDSAEASGLDHGHYRPDYTVAIINRVHDFRHTVAPRFRREVRDRKGDDHAADDRHHNDQHAPRTRGVNRLAS
jgi:hypothetical protein